MLIPEFLTNIYFQFLFGFVYNLELLVLLWMSLKMSFKVSRIMSFYVVPTHRTLEQLMSDFYEVFLNRRHHPESIKFRPCKSQDAFRRL